MANRSRKAEIEYKKYRQQELPSSSCPFCAIANGNKEDEQFLEEGKYFIVIKVRFRYTYWDEQNVTDQLMLVPKKHINSISKLPLKAAEEFMNFLGKYEDKGYSIYARTSGATSRTIPHQHTHLIKVQGRSKKFMLHLRKPYVLIMR